MVQPAGRFLGLSLFFIVLISVSAQDDSFKSVSRVELKNGEALLSWEKPLVCTGVETSYIVDVDADTISLPETENSLSVHVDPGQERQVSVTALCPEAYDQEVDILKPEFVKGITLDKLVQELHDFVSFKVTDSVIGVTFDRADHPLLTGEIQIVVLEVLSGNSETFYLSSTSNAYSFVHAKSGSIYRFDFFGASNAGWTHLAESQVQTRRARAITDYTPELLVFVNEETFTVSWKFPNTQRANVDQWKVEIANDMGTVLETQVLPVEAELLRFANAQANQAYRVNVDVIWKANIDPSQVEAFSFKEINFKTLDKAHRSQDIVVEAGYYGFVVRWAQQTGASAYEIGISLGEVATFKIVKPSSHNFHLFTWADAGTEYDISVSVTRPDSSKTVLGTLAARTLSFLPIHFEKLWTPVSDTEIHFIWTFPNEYEDSIEDFIFTIESSSGLEFLKAGRGLRSLTFNKALAGTKYNVKLEANSYGERLLIDETEVTTLTKKVGNEQFELLIGANVFVVSWLNPADPVSFHTLLVEEFASDASKYSFEIAPTETSYVFWNSIPSTKYRITLNAFKVSDTTNTSPLVLIDSVEFFTLNVHRMLDDGNEASPTQPGRAFAVSASSFILVFLEIEGVDMKDVSNVFIEASSDQAELESRKFTFGNDLKVFNFSDVVPGFIYKFKVSILYKGQSIVVKSLETVSLASDIESDGFAIYPGDEYTVFSRIRPDAESLRIVNEETGEEWSEVLVEGFEYTIVKVSPSTHYTVHARSGSEENLSSKSFRSLGDGKIDGDAFVLVSSNKFEIYWELPDAFASSIESIEVEIKEISAGAEAVTVQVKHDERSYVVTDAKPLTRYRVTVTPVYELTSAFNYKFETMYLQTLSQPLADNQVETIIGSGSFKVYWKAPATASVVTIQVSPADKNEESKSVTLAASKGEAVVTGLTPASSYTVLVSATSEQNGNTELGTVGLRTTNPIEQKKNSGRIYAAIGSTNFALFWELPDDASKQVSSFRLEVLSLNNWVETAAFAISNVARTFQYAEASSNSKYRVRLSVVPKDPSKQGCDVHCFEEITIHTFATPVGTEKARVLVGASDFFAQWAPPSVPLLQEYQVEVVNYDSGKSFKSVTSSPFFSFTDFKRGSLYDLKVNAHATDLMIPILDEPFSTLGFIPKFNEIYPVVSAESIRIVWKFSTLLSRFIERVQLRVEAPDIPGFSPQVVVQENLLGQRIPFIDQDEISSCFLLVDFSSAAPGSFYILNFQISWLRSVPTYFPQRFQFAVNTLESNYLNQFMEVFPGSSGFLVSWSSPTHADNVNALHVHVDDSPVELDKASTFAFFTSSYELHNAKVSYTTGAEVISADIDFAMLTFDGLPGNAPPKVDSSCILSENEEAIFNVKGAQTMMVFWKIQREVLWKAEKYQVVVTEDINGASNQKTIPLDKEHCFFMWNDGQPLAKVDATVQVLAASGEILQTFPTQSISLLEKKIGNNDVFAMIGENRFVVTWAVPTVQVTKYQVFVTFYTVDSKGMPDSSKPQTTKTYDVDTETNWLLIETDSSQRFSSFSVSAILPGGSATELGDVSNPSLELPSENPEDGGVQPSESSTSKKTNLAIKIGSVVGALLALVGFAIFVHQWRSGAFKPKDRFDSVVKYEMKLPLRKASLTTPPVDFTTVQPEKVRIQPPGSTGPPEYIEMKTP